MSQKTRQDRIGESIARKGECSIAELVKQLDVSGMTIRRDLRALAEQGKVIRTHGGAALAERVSFEFDFLNRVKENQAAKKAIAATAAVRVEDGQSVMLDSGTTTLALAEQLRGKRGLTIVTTSLPIAARLQYDPETRVLLPGGYVQASSPDLVGALTEANLETLHADVAFLGVHGIDRRGTVYQKSSEVARMLTRMAAAVERVFIVADGSKLGRTGLSRFGRLQDWDALITAAADRSFLASLRKAGVRVITAPVKKK